MDPLFPNPGGFLDPEDLVGRAHELAQLTEALSRGGAHVTGERRMGKTSLLVRLEADLTAAGRVVIRVSAETDSLDTFGNRLLEQLRLQRLVSSRVAAWEKELQGSVSVKVLDSGITLSGKMRKDAESEATWDLIDLLASTAAPAGAVLVIDEITVLAHALGPAGAAEFLSGLRAARQGSRPVALVVSGSIGLHHALHDTRPINDLREVKVGPLDAAGAEELATRLLLGIDAEPTPELVAEIMDATGGIPYYMQAVLDQWRYTPAQSIDDIVERCILDNTWHTEHYVSRIDDYYGTDDAPTVRAIVDEFALAGPSGLTLAGVQTRLALSLDNPPTRDLLISLLGRLEKDHHLRRERTHDVISSPLLARIWRLHRRLT